MNAQKSKKAKDYCVIKHLALLILFCLCLALSALGQDINFAWIAEIESSNNPKAISYAGAKYGRGLYQVSEILLREWNNYHPGDKHSIKELFIPEVNEEIAAWYINNRIPAMLRTYKIPENPTTILASYNWGIGNVKKWYRQGARFSSLPKETRIYIKKYENKKRSYAKNP